MSKKIGILLLAILFLIGFHSRSQAGKGAWDSLTEMYHTTTWRYGDIRLISAAGDTLILSSDRWSITDGTDSTWANKDTVSTSVSICDTIAVGYTLIQFVVKADTLTSYSDAQITIPEDVVIDSTLTVSGKVGIGTTSPYANEEIATSAPDWAIYDSDVEHPTSFATIDTAAITFSQTAGGNWKITLYSDTGASGSFEVDSSGNLVYPAIEYAQADTLRVLTELRVSTCVVPDADAGANIGAAATAFKYAWIDTVYAEHYGGQSPMSLGGKEEPVTVLGDLQVNGKMSVLSSEGKKVQIDLYQLAQALEEQTGRDIVVEEKKSLLKRIKNLW